MSILPICENLLINSPVSQTNGTGERENIMKDPGSSRPCLENLYNICASKIEEPSVIKFPLMGPYIIDFESSATTLTQEQVQAAKDFYSNFIEQAVNKLIENGHKKPVNEEELSALCKDIISIIWDKENFSYKDDSLLLNGLATETKTLDFSTSSYVAADILNQFGVSSKLVSLPDYSNLHCSINGISIYVNTSSIADFKVYKSEEEVKEKYGSIYGEFKFEMPNPIFFNNRGIAKTNSKNYSGAIADFTMAINLFPKGPKAYYNRAIAKVWSGNCDGAIFDISNTIYLDPDFADAYYSGACVEYGRGNYEKAIKYCNNYLDKETSDEDRFAFMQVVRHLANDQLSETKKVVILDDIIHSPEVNTEWLNKILDEAGLICHQK